MKTIGKNVFSKRVITYEVVGFLFVILIIWLDEIIDIPSLFFGVPQTPINWGEAIFESGTISILGAIIIYVTMKLFKNMKYLEGILPVCASCKKIRDDKGSWHEIEEYIRDKSEAEFSHGICPQCAAKLYPECNPYKKNDKQYNNATGP
jgi:hypothetical protein